MKGLIRNYIDLLDTKKIDEFAKKNNIYLNNDELEFLLKLIKKNFEDILINDSKFYFLSFLFLLYMEHVFLRKEFLIF